MHRENPDCLGGGGGIWGGQCCCSPGLCCCLHFLLASVPSESSMWEEERPWAPLYASMATVLPLVPPEPICSLSHSGSISGASHWRCTPRSLPSSRCLLGPPSLVCKAGMVGGWQLSREGPQEWEPEAESGGLGGWGEESRVEAGRAQCYLTLQSIFTCTSQGLT